MLIVIPFDSIYPACTLQYKVSIVENWPTMLFSEGLLMFDVKAPSSVFTYEKSLFC